MESSALRRNHHEDNHEACSSHSFKAEWPPDEEEFVIFLDDNRWNLGSVQGYKVDADEIEVQLLDPLKTRAKDNHGKTYWIYSANDQSDVYTRNHVLIYLHLLSLSRISNAKTLFLLCKTERW